MHLPDDVTTVLTRRDRMSAYVGGEAEVWSDQHCVVTYDGIKRERPDAPYHSMREMYGAMKDQTVFICGSGPSLLNAPEKLPGPTFCINKAITKVKADFWCFSDLAVWRLYKDAPFSKDAKVAIGAGMHLFFPDHPVYLIEADGKPSRYVKPEKRPLYWNCATLSWVLHWAVKMQPKRIVLVGCDHSLGGHFDGTEAYERKGEASVMCFKIARARMDEMFGPDKAEWFDPSVEILDAALDGYLPLPKVKLEDVL